MWLVMVSADVIVDYFEKKYPESFCIKGKVDSVDGFCSLEHLKDNCLVWIKNCDAFDLNMFSSNSGLLFIGNKMVEEIPDGMCFIACSESKAAFFSVIEQFFTQKKKAMISDKSIIETNHIGSNVSVGHFSFLCSDVIVGDNVTIGNNVSIECPCTIGSDTIIGSGTIIGNDGYGYYIDENDHPKKVPHTGGVSIGCHVDIGANVCIDRGTIDNTTIGDYAKIDNLCHIAHNVSIGENAMVIALTLLGGSSRIAKNAYIAPGVMIMNQKRVGENSLVGMGAVVINDVPSDVVVAGVPAKILKRKER